ncbi:uncharacterized protein LOC122003651 [Zingiber officinale]|uniref:uncharacterized protein LOC122003651 n=1 Tax=Zingiber officinale TaxID=94328 RepID=UPI001C4AC79E|nr:uncharacterized protein LOC122003651 [Zingiber officinale]
MEQKSQYLAVVILSLHFELKLELIVNHLVLLNQNLLKSVLLYFFHCFVLVEWILNSNFLVQDLVNPVLVQQNLIQLEYSSLVRLWFFQFEESTNSHSLGLALFEKVDNIAGKADFAAGNFAQVAGNCWKCG